MVQTDAHPAAAVLEDEASPAVKRVFDGIKSALRVPLVNLVFRDLARYPDFLELAWRQLEPNVRTVYCEQRADEIRARAVDAVAELGTAPGLDDEQAKAALRVFHYVDSKLLVAVAALRAAAGGQSPRLEELPRESKVQIPAGIPADAPSITLVDPNADGPAHDLLGRIRDATGVPAVNNDYRALAQWPDYLDRAWTELERISGEAAFRAAQREIRLMAEEALLALPFRIETSPHVMRLCGLSENEIDDVRQTIERYYRALPGLILNVAYLTAGAVGAQQARHSPFPV